MEVLGEELAVHCQGVKLQGSTVVVVTANPAFAHQLRLDGEPLLGRLNAMVPGRRLRALKVRTGRAR